MSEANGVIRVGRRGVKKFAFGDGDPFSVDLVRAWRRWVAVDEGFRPPEEDAEGRRPIPDDRMPAYYDAACTFVKELGGPGDLSPGDALDFIARLREQYDDLADFFRPRSREERASPGTSAAPSMVFSEES